MSGTAFPSINWLEPKPPKPEVRTAKSLVYCDSCQTVCIRPGDRYVADNGRTLCVPAYLAERKIEDDPSCLA